MSDEEPEASEEKGKANRSPRYPADGLETCVAKVRRVYEAEKKSVTSTRVVVKHMGYSSLSGAARVALSAAKKFGLLVEEGAERARVSDDAVRLFVAPDETMKLALLRKFARTPELVRELLDEHPDGLPSDESLRYKLVADRGFGEQAANTFIRALRETVRVAKLGPGEYVSPSKETAPPKEDDEPPAPKPQMDQSTRQQQTPPKPPTNGSALHFELSDGTAVDVVATGPLSSETLDELLDYLKVYEKVLKKRSATDEKAS